MIGNASEDKEVGQDIDHVDGLQLAIDEHCQAFMGELVDDIEHAELAAVMSAVLDEVAGPDVIGPLRPQADARSIREPQTPAFWLFLGDLQPLPSPPARPGRH